MSAYVLRRILGLVPVVWAVVTLVWIFMFAVPGEPARLLAGGQSADPVVLARIRAEWRLDDPAPWRYRRFVGRLAPGDLGTSDLQGRPVARVKLTSAPLLVL